MTPGMQTDQKESEIGDSTYTHKQSMMSLTGQQEWRFNEP